MGWIDKDFEEKEKKRDELMRQGYSGEVADIIIKYGWEEKNEV